jgi:hypothetical protein
LNVFETGLMAEGKAPIFFPASCKVAVGNVLACDKSAALNRGMSVRVVKAGLILFISRSVFAVGGI